MCTFQDERSVMVCDVSIGRVRRDLAAAGVGAVRFTVVDGEGTLVEAAANVAPGQFEDVVRAAIAAQQDRGER